MGRPLLRGQPPDPACGAHGPDPRCSREKVGQGRGRPPKADRCRRAEHHLCQPTPWPTNGAREGNLNAEEGWWDSTHRVVLIIFGRLMGSVGFWAYGYDRTRNILVCLTLAQENAYT